MNESVSLRFEQLKQWDYVVTVLIDECCGANRIGCGDDHSEYSLSHMVCLYAYVYAGVYISSCCSSLTTVPEAMKYISIEYCFLFLV
jgi:hypothetical protein